MLGRLFQKKMVDQDQFTSGPYVAVWVGHHTSEEQLDDYLFSGRFSEEFHFRVEDRRLPETCVEPTPKPLGELVHGFSRYQKFQDEFQFSAEVEFTRSDLERFVKHLLRVHNTLNGSFDLESTDTRFRFVGTADNIGRVRIDVSVSGFQFSQPENNEWTASATFTCFPQELEGTITELTKANKPAHPTAGDVSI